MFIFRVAPTITPCLRQEIPVPNRLLKCTRIWSSTAVVPIAMGDGRPRCVHYGDHFKTTSGARNKPQYQRQATDTTDTANSKRMKEEGTTTSMNRKDAPASRSAPDKSRSSAASWRSGSRQTDITYARYWNETRFGWEYRNRRHPRGLEFSVMSYNVLAQQLISENRDLYSHCQPEILEWEYRKNIFLQQFQLCGSDIICLQEVQKDHYEDFFLPVLSQLGYQGVYKKRTGYKIDGCATFIKSRTFQLERVELVEYLTPGVSVLDRDNVAIVLLLRFGGGRGEKLCVANTHLLFNPRRGDVRLAQVGKLLAEVDRLVGGDGGPCPVILCGDFNSLPYSPLYHLLARGVLNYGGMMAGHVSGLPEGSHRPSAPLPQPLWGHPLAISHRCQYYTRSRDGEGAQSGDAGRQGSAASEGGLKGPPPPGGQTADRQPCADRAEAEMAGTIRHPFSLSSAYFHRTRSREMEVTTNHQKANYTVDYIFSSSNHHFATRGGAGPSDRLRLLSRLTLFSDRQVMEMGGIPNGIFSSDHFSLQAKFVVLNS